MDLLQQSLPQILASFTRIPKGYTILVCHSGQANGWNFSEVVMQKAVPLFEGVKCMTDHDMFSTPSVDKVCGVLSNPRWSDEHRGILADIRPAGARADLLRAYADEMLSANTPKPNIGFSPVLAFTAKGDDAIEIMRVPTVDLVVDPAFHSRFIAEKFQQRSNPPMKKFILPDGSVVDLADDAAPPTGATPYSETTFAMRELTTASAQIAAEVQGAREVHLQACQDLLTSSLDAAVDLPEKSKNVIRKHFQGKTFKPAELNAEIKEMREAFAATNAADEIAGPQRVTAMFNSADQLQAAMDDLLGAPREKGAETLKVHQFSGIKDAYLFLTGDRNFVGDIDPRLAAFQGTTATFPNLVANALNKAILVYWKKYGENGYNWWEKIATVEHFNSLHDITWLRLGTIASLPVVGEGDAYPELSIGDNGEASTFYKYGGYLSFTLEAMDKDDTRRLRAAPREIALAAIRNISEQVAALFTTNSAAGPVLDDTGALFNATAVTTAGGHANLLTTALGTDYTAWNAIAAAMYNQPMHVANETGKYGTGKKQALDPRYILVPRALKNQAEALFLPRWEATAQNVAAVSPSWGGRVEVLTVPEWTDATDYAAAADKDLAPGVMIGERYGLVPTVIIAGDQRDPAMFSNDESRLKVRHFLATGIGDWRALHKSNVA